MFKEFFGPKNDGFNIDVIQEEEIIDTLSEAKTPEDKIRKAGIKIKSTMPSPLGTFIEFFNKDDLKKASKIVKPKSTKGNTILVSAD